MPLLYEALNRVATSVDVWPLVQARHRVWKYDASAHHCGRVSYLIFRLGRGVQLTL